MRSIFALVVFTVLVAGCATQPTATSNTPVPQSDNGKIHLRNGVDTQVKLGVIMNGSVLCSIVADPGATVDCGDPVTSSVSITLHVQVDYKHGENEGAVASPSSHGFVFTKFGWTLPDGTALNPT